MRIVGLFVFVFALLECLLTSFVTPCNLVKNFDGSCFDLQATPYVTKENSNFGPFIEGTSVNPHGDIFAVNYGDSSRTYQLGQLYPKQRLFYRDRNTKSLLNGIRFKNAHTAFIADAVNHRVLRLTVNCNNEVVNSQPHCWDNSMLQPNDLTLSHATGTIFTSGMKWISDTNNTHGDLWSCLPNGTAQRLDVMGRTNGIDLSPDEKWLYVSESYNRDGTPYIQRIWKYQVDVQNGRFSIKQIFADFQQLDGSVTADIDGIKTNVNGLIFVARHGGQQVAVLDPNGHLVGKIALSFPNPTNLEFGGPNGTTLFIVGQCSVKGKGCVDTVEMSHPGHSWSQLQKHSFHAIL